MEATARLIIVEGGYNIRDLGGYPTQDGRFTRWHTLIRSGGFDQITPAGQAQLVQYGVKTVIDLRDEIEVRDYPDVFAQNPDVDYRHLPLSPGGFAAKQSYTRLHELYCAYLGSLQANVGAIISAIAAAEPGILFHCYAGKDRTGLVSAFLLGLVGVTNEIIAGDYAQTVPHIAHLVVQWREYAIQNGQNMERFAADVSADAETMLTTLNVIEAEYGGIASYLRACGVTDHQIGRLQALLVG